MRFLDLFNCSENINFPFPSDYLVNSDYQSGHEGSFNGHIKIDDNGNITSNELDANSKGCMGADGSFISTMMYCHNYEKVSGNIELDENGNLAMHLDVTEYEKNDEDRSADIEIKSSHVDLQCIGEQDGCYIFSGVDESGQTFVLKITTECKW